MPGIFLTTNIFAHVGGFFLCLDSGGICGNRLMAPAAMVQKFDYGFCVVLWVISLLAVVTSPGRVRSTLPGLFLAKSDLTS